jgi:hypothetical protein
VREPAAYLVVDATIAKIESYLQRSDLLAASTIFSRLGHAPSRPRGVPWDPVRILRRFKQIHLPARHNKNGVISAARQLRDRDTAKNAICVGKERDQLIF